LSATEPLIGLLWIAHGGEADDRRSEARQGGNMMLRRAAVIAAGLAMATSFGLSGAGVASAAAPALKIKQQAIWTVEVTEGKLVCELVSFDTSDNTFITDHAGDAGTWSGGASTIGIAWTAGPDIGLTFSGHLVSTAKPAEYKGVVSLDGESVKAKLKKDALPSYRGSRC
jgi:hypothetical protein